METYKYQMHTHTAPCSLCASMTPEELAEALNKGGYQGCVMTNHFMMGNTGIDRALPWNDFVKQYELDYLACKEAAAKYDKDIIFGIEENVHEMLEVIFYGVTPDMLYEHPELAGADYKTWYEVMHSYGVLCIQAHPFRDRGYIPKPGMLPLEYIDGIEVYNVCNTQKNNEDAEEYVKDHPELLLISGADAHAPNLVCVSGIETKKRIRDGKDLVEVLKTGDYRLLKED